MPRRRSPPLPRPPALTTLAMLGLAALGPKPAAAGEPPESERDPLLEPQESALERPLPRPPASLIASTPASDRIAAEIFVLTDRQEKFLGGQRTYVQSSTIDGVVDVAVRPVAVDLFGFTVYNSYNLALQAYREEVDHPVVLLDTGDVADLGCAQELSLAWRSLDPDRAPGLRQAPPDLLSVGNHDVTSFGNFRDESDLIGWIPGLGDDYRERIWVASCAEARSELDLRRQCIGLLGERCDDLTAIHVLEKEAFALGALERLYGLPAAPTARLLASSRGRYRVEGPDGAVRAGRWGEVQDLEHVMEAAPPALRGAAAVFDDFWTTLPDGRAVAAVETPGKDPGQRWILLSAAPVDAEEQIWLVAADSTDQTRVSPPVPGGWGTYSSLQVKLLQALIAQIRVRSPEARFIFATHFPRRDTWLRRGVTWRRTGMRDLYVHPRVLFHVAGHTHAPGVRRPPMRERDTLRRDQALFEYISHSTLDYPNGGLRLQLDADGGAAVNHFGRPDDPERANARVQAALQEQRVMLAEYRALRQQITDPALLGIGTLKDSTPRDILRNVVRYMGGQARRGTTTRYRVGVLDVRPLMEHQFEEMLVYLQGVTELLGAEPDADLHAICAPVREDLQIFLAFAWAHFEQWRAETGPDENRMDLFRFTCDLAGEEDVNCVGALQRRLRDVPWGTDAYALMQLFALEGARAEYCTSPDPYLDKIMPGFADCEDVPE